ncbi:MAG TPA: hypothetical protein PKE06_03965 [Flavilitoribacter sp.]|nr:hypothetical protein [Flavilitoribacter sp.]HMQ88370.1 hypothetical protein [Flavilitoribacter sp.]
MSKKNNFIKTHMVLLGQYHNSILDLLGEKLIFKNCTCNDSDSLRLQIQSEINSHPVFSDYFDAEDDCLIYDAVGNFCQFTSTADYRNAVANLLLSTLDSLEASNLFGPQELKLYCQIFQEGFWLSKATLINSPVFKSIFDDGKNSDIIFFNELGVLCNFQIF